MNPSDERLDPRFSTPGAAATSWADAAQQMDSASTYWLTTVRPDGRPHVTTIAGVWLEDAIHFMTGSSERKAHNLRGNQRVVVTTGCNGWEGLDIVVEGDAVRVTAADRLTSMAAAFTDKYDDFFGVRYEDGEFTAPGSGGELLAFEVLPTKAFGFEKGSTVGQTRWRWPRRP